MAKPKDCGNCKKPATIHLTQIINNEIKKLDFCEDCPHQKGVTDPAGFSLAELLANGPAESGHAVPGNTHACPECGYTVRDFKKTGLFGCPGCYDAFQSTIEPMLEGMHRGQSHVGKIPQRVRHRVSHHRELERLRRNLEDAVAEERFEDAAQHRDALRQLQDAISPDSQENDQTANK